MRERERERDGSSRRRSGVVCARKSVAMADSSGSVTCTMTAAGLSYPDRFLVAAANAGFSSPGDSSAKLTPPRFSKDSSLLLYALYQQAMVGRCNTARPWAWNTFEVAKWSSWNQLGTMTSMEAMRLFVRTLEEEDPEWFSKYLKQEGIDSSSISQSKAVAENTAATSETSQINNEPSSNEAVEPALNGGYVTVDAESPSELSENGEFLISEVDIVGDRPDTIGDHAPEEQLNVISHQHDEQDGTGGCALEAVTTYNKWISPLVTGRKPSGRYQHAAAILHDKMYVIGGNHNGRFLNDIQVLDLHALMWSKLEPKLAQGPAVQTTLPPCAGHRVISWGRSLLLVTGHSKTLSERVKVYALDTDTTTWSLLPSYGQAPVARGGHSVSLVGSSLVMFGGEDSKRQLLNDLDIFDLETMTWDTVQPVGAPPSPRSDHAAAVHNDRYLFIFGGASHSTCLGDLHVLDLKSMEWSQPPSYGALPTPRAGHAGVVIGDNWYIAGGGDNRTGISEMVLVNLGSSEWSISASVPAQTSIASEGLSMLTTTVNGEEAILAFAGYNGYYSNEFHVFRTRFKSMSQTASIKTVDLVRPAPSALLDSFIQQSPATCRTSTVEAPSHENQLLEANHKHVARERKLSSPLQASKEEVKIAAEFQEEIMRLQLELAAALSSSSTLKKELQSVRGQLVAEQSRCFRLEVDVAELRQKLQSLEVLEKELDMLRRQKTASEEAATLAAYQGQNSGTWKWLTRAPSHQKPNEA